MQKNQKKQEHRSLRDRRGFSTLFLLILGGLMILIAGGYGAFIQSENGQMTDNANSATKGNSLTFVAQTMQSDFYNNQLQVEFDKTIVDYLVAGTHIIDPSRGFDDNLGDDIEDLLEDQMGGIVSGGASETYAIAYSTVPGLLCTQLQESGGRALVDVNANSDGTITIGSSSIGQRIKCRDTDSNDEVVIDLQGRDYRVNTRAALIHDIAVKTILEAQNELENTEAMDVIQSGWRVHDDDTVKNNLLNGQEGWNAKIAQLGLLLVFVGDDGVILDPTSVKIRNENGAAYNTEDLKFSCDGDVKSANARGPQTCRPDNLNIHIGEKFDNSENSMEINLEEVTPNSNFEVTIVDSGIEIGVSSALSAKIGQLIGQMTGSLKEGYVDYFGDITHLCNRFKARPNDFVITGTVVETNPNYLSSGIDNIRFNFQSKDVSLDTSDISSDIDCNSSEYKNVIKTNVYDLLTNGGQEVFKIDVNAGTGGSNMIPDVENAKDLERIVNKNAMVRTTGETKSVSVTVNSKSFQATSTATPQKTIPTQSQTNLQTIATTTPNPQNSVIQKNIQTSISAGNTQNTLSAMMNLFDDSAGALSSIGETTDAEALAKSSTALCKMIGMKNWEAKGNKQMAIMAICGMGLIADEKVSKIICTLGALYQAVESGSAEASIMVLTQMMGAAGMDLSVDASQIRAAVEANDVEAVLLIAAEAAKGSGDFEGFDVLMQVAAVVKGVDLDNPLPAAAGLFSVLGENDMAEFFMSLNGIDTAIESKDFGASISAAARLAKSLGYSGSTGMGGEVLGAIGAFAGIASLDNVEVACKELAIETALCADVAMGPLICGAPPPQFSQCAFSYSGPSLDVGNFCDDLVFDLGFKIDCTCFYTCPAMESVVPWPRSVSVNINMLRMVLDADQYASLLSNFDLDAHLGSPDLMNYCKLDP